MSIKVEVISRHGCHLCEIAESVVCDVMKEVDFELLVKYVDEDDLLNQEYGEEVPVTLINGQRHDYFKVDRERFKNAILRLRQ